MNLVKLQQHLTKLHHDPNNELSVTIADIKQLVDHVRADLQAACAVDVKLKAREHAIKAAKQEHVRKELRAEAQAKQHDALKFERLLKSRRYNAIRHTVDYDYVEALKAKAKAGCDASKQALQFLDVFTCEYYLECPTQQLIPRAELAQQQRARYKANHDLLNKTLRLLPLQDEEVG